MDELIIEDKKYISSKQAAKLTGYAKDYVGQLCREGRIAARLVGRNWYVLESAIQDHRFGPDDKKADPEPEKPEARKTKEAVLSTWEPARYEPADVKTFMTQAEETEDGEHGETSVVASHVQDTWKEWFERISTSVEEEPVAETDKMEKPEEENVIEEASHIQESRQDEIDEPIESEVNVPIKAIYNEVPKELLPKRVLAHSERREEYVAVDQPGANKVALVRLTGALVAVAMLVLALIGTGYFDSYMISNNSVGFLAGVAAFEK